MNENDPSKIVQLPKLDKGGRFGNQLFKYAHVKGYCKKHNYTLEIPKNWIGRRIFKNIDDNVISENLPIIKEEIIPHKIYNCGININSQNQQALSFYSRKDVKYWFELEDKYKFPKIKDFYIAAHLRRGDYFKAKDFFAILSKSCYVKAIKRFGYSTKKVIFTPSDNVPNEIELPADLLFLYDFNLLKNADVLFRANSTFSWWAATLGNGKIFSPVVDQKCGWTDDIEFTEGNHPKCTDSKFHKGLVLTDLYLSEE